MVSAEQAREIALFYLLSLLDQKLALQAAHKSIAQLKSIGSENGSHSQVDIARLLRKGFDLHRRMLARNQPTEMSPDAMQFPDGTDFQTWQKFHRASADGEITAVILTKVLGYPEATIAKGFGVSSGTMKYRVAKGVRQLGAILNKTGNFS